MAQEAEAKGKPKAPTIYDVAERAGVSHQTVSRYLKNKTALKPSTLERVERALSELNYTPNLAARALRSRELYRIVVVVPEASLYFPTRMLNGAAAAAHAAGYRVDVVAMEGTAEDRAQQLRNLLSGEDIAGILSFVPRPKPAVEVDARIPLVVAGEYDNKMRARGSLADGTAAATIVEYLASLGHQDFFHVSGPLAWPSARNRKAAYEKAVTELGLRSAGTASGDWSPASGYAAGKKIARLPDVTAVVAANDQMAIGVIRALHEKGISVPGDVSVFGWDDMAESAFLVPALSTVRMDLEALGARSMGELIARVRGVNTAAEPLTLDPMELVFRESTGPARAGGGAAVPPPIPGT
ncbi:LacI family DNA-binding transcriptional regulator [Arthrobacter nitrophenolicus]|uniref:DNA-binding LacI/PurR family transcriptional regulator n=2 Tax=Arthrobacter nitrophenolicus TaxID=683150 RepID=A0ACC6TJW9_9MICC|nr:LacI family DNA-binding transcriptional regulator [Arthrobacter nitrophenolicus]ELT44775.1 LacI family transcriptional regulator [Arthrobacter nitrophenolicus]